MWISVVCFAASLHVDHTADLRHSQDKYMGGNSYVSLTNTLLALLQPCVPCNSLVSSKNWKGIGHVENLDFDVTAL